VTPTQRPLKRLLGIVADDLTGAMDSSGYFAANGLSTEVVLDHGYNAQSDVVVVTTSSRAEPLDVARERVREAVGGLAGRTVYKKIDSTLRGNIGEELTAAMEAAGCVRAVVAPAFPAVGRATENGVLLVDGTPVAETQFARDPVSPVAESHIPTLLEKATGRSAACVGAARVQGDADILREYIDGLEADLVVCDATEQQHLGRIAEAAGLAGDRWLLCGSGGMARELHRLFGDRAAGQTPSPLGRSAGPALAVVGSRNQVSITQLKKAASELDLPVLEIETRGLEHGRGEAQTVAAQAKELLAEGRSLAVTSALSAYVPGLTGAIPSVLAAVVEDVTSSHTLGGLFLSGGDIALAVCARLSVAAIRVQGEIEPGIPAGEVVGGRTEGMRLVTKAGGFGTRDALVLSMRYLEKGFQA